MSTFVLNVQDIDEAGKDYSFPVTHAWLRHVLEDAEVRPNEAEPEGHLQIRAHRQGNDMVLHGSLRSALVTDCARCLSDALISVDVQVSLLLSARSTHPRSMPVEQDLTPEDLDRDTYSGDKIVLDSAVREHLLLEVPIKPLCQDACPGIAVPASVAGPRDLKSETEGGIDPRLAPLMKLVGQMPTEE